MRWLLTRATFPVLLGGAVAATLIGIQHGGDPLLLTGGATSLVALALAALERAHPYQPDWNRARGDLPTDAIHLLVSMLVLPQLVRIFWFGVVIAAGARLSSRLGWQPWPTTWPLLAQYALALVIADFLTYWAHRLMHERALLWRFHAVHHSPSRLYWLNAARFHPLDTLLLHLLEVTPLLLAGCPSGVLALFMVHTGVNGMFKHCNVDVRIGWLNWICSASELHRWHHSLELDQANSNYGNNLSLWDWIFGTFLRTGAPPRAVGLADRTGFPAGYLAQLGAPFRRARSSARGGAAG